jgi:hypothetical protein
VWSNIFPPPQLPKPLGLHAPITVKRVREHNVNIPDKNEYPFPRKITTCRGNMGWPPEETLPMADKGCIFNVNDDPAGLTWWSTQLAIVPANKTIPSGVEGNFFVIDGKAMVHSAAFVMEFTETDDAVIYAFKVNGTVVYAIGIPVPKLLAWSPPADKTKLCEDTAMLTAYKLPHAGMTKMKPLVNTDTVKLRDKADALLSYLPLFKFALIKSLKVLTDVSSDNAKQNLSRAVGAAALRWKKAAAARGRATGADGESVAGGESASGAAKQLEAALLPSMKYYDEIFDNRFITLTTHGGKLTEESFDNAREFLRCVPCQCHARLQLTMHSLAYPMPDYIKRDYIILQVAGARSGEGADIEAERDAGGCGGA